MKRSLVASVVLVLGLSGAGCIIPKMSHGKIKGWYVIVPQGHIHSSHCGHYHSGGGWYMIEGHVHGDGCGHYHRGGNWCSDD